MGEGKNFFSREKKFFPSPTPPSFFKKSGVCFAPVGRKTGSINLSFAAGKHFTLKRAVANQFATAL